MLAHDPVPWLMAQSGRPALRARRALGLERPGDRERAQTWAEEMAAHQTSDGSIGGTLLGTAGALILLVDLRVRGADRCITAAAEHLVAVLESQPGYEAAQDLAPESWSTPCDLCGFFGPYGARGEPQVRERGAAEMNALRQYEPLLGPQSPVRSVPRSSRDRAGPSSCYSWGLIPLSYTLVALCRAGYGSDERLQPAVHALLAVQRESGGWCRNLGGHPDCTLHAVRALGAHPGLRSSEHARRALAFLHRSRMGATRAFAVLRAAAWHTLPEAAGLVQAALALVAPRQRRDGSFGQPHPIERATAVVQGLRALECIQLDSSTSPQERT